MKDIDALRQEIKALRERLSRLQTAAVRINASLDLPTVLRAILDNAREASSAVYGLINTINEAGLPEDLVTSGLTPEEHRQLTLMPDGMQLFEQVRDLRGARFFSDLPPEVHARIATAGLVRARSFMSLPLHYRDKYVGNFFLMGKTGGGEFTSEDEDYQVLFTSLAAAAIANARTYRNEQRARANLEALVDTAPIGVAVFDAKAGHLLLINQEARRLVDGLRTPDRSYQQLLEEVRCKRADGRMLSLGEVTLAHQLKNAEPVRSEEIELSVRDGQSVRVLLNATPIRSADDVVVSMVVTMQDLAQLAELERLRAEFISMVSHELRAPLASIKGSSTSVIVESEALERAEILQFMHLIDKQADLMRHLIGDLLDVGRIDTGTLTIDPEPWSLADIVERARNMFTGGVHGHAILVELPGTLPRVMADSLRVVQVLSNLFANAARHSPEHTPIRVTAEHTDVYVAVSVADQGMGIAPERLKHLFDRYADWSDNKKAGLRGAGLGLAICKGLVEAQGGRIWARSNGVGHGTEITFTIPVAEAPDSTGSSHARDARADLSRYHGEPARILVVDDDPNMLRFVRDALTEAGYHVTVTASPQELSSVIRKEKPRLVLLDLMLPGTDGVALIDQIPELAELPIIFISGYRKDDTIVRALDAGAVDYIVKPFSPSELTARIRAALRTHTEAKTFVLGNLAIDYEEHRVTVAGRPVQLTAKEYKLLRVLSIKPGRVLKHSTLIRAVWDEPNYAHPGLLRTFVFKLRSKLGQGQDQPDYITNVRGIGYKMAKPDEL